MFKCFYTLTIAFITHKQIKVWESEVFAGNLRVCDNLFTQNVLNYFTF